MKITIPATMIDKIINKLPQTLDRERCGVFTGKRGINGDIEATDYAFVRNRHPDPENNFRIFTEDVARRLRGEVVGVFHTHVNGNAYPSEADVSNLRGTNRFGVVIDMTTCTYRIYTEHSEHHEGN